MTPRAFQAACRKEFAFLSQSYGFRERVLPAKGQPDQVVFEKHGWKIAIVGTAHGTRASIVIYSPQGETGFFSHLVERGFEEQKRPEFGQGQRADISLKACCLRTFGTRFLDGEWQDFKVLRKRQMQWIVESGIMTKAELRRYQRLYGQPKD